ncbi:MAG: hypothetical protein HUK28_04090 [Methanobrevibacter sp.]|nr:hypothetical protein [Methanobrevibacter sp.]
MRWIIKILLFVIVVAVIAFFSTANILIIATDTTEGNPDAPGVDMGAIWSAGGGLEWIYPGSSFNSNHQTLHNIYYDTPDNPYKGAADIIEYTYHKRPNLIVTVNNNASQRIYGDNLVNDIRSYDWQQGYDRAPAIDAATQNKTPNILGVITSIFTGDIAFHFV